MRGFTIVYLIGIGYPRELRQNEQCSRKPSLNDYQHLLNVSQNQSGIQTLDSKDSAVRTVISILVSIPLKSLEIIINSRRIQQKYLKMLKSESESTVQVCSLKMILNQIPLWLPSGWFSNSKSNTMKYSNK